MLARDWLALEGWCCVDMGDMGVYICVCGFAGGGGGIILGGESAGTNMVLYAFAIYIGRSKRRRRKIRRRRRRRM